jgi:hypothetical protein
MGWGLANYWSCAPADMPRHRYRIRLASVVALALAIWIGSDEVLSGLSAMVIVALSASVAYAGRARQISSLGGGTGAATPADPEQGQSTAVVVVTHALPEAYTGPEYWAACLSHRSASAHQRPNWFTAPLAVRRIRSTYLQMGSAPASFTALAELVNRLQARLPPEVLVQSAHPYAVPSVDSQLAVLTGRAASLSLIVPIDLEESDRDDLSRQIAGSGWKCCPTFGSGCGARSAPIATWRRWSARPSRAAPPTCLWTALTRWWHLSARCWSRPPRWRTSRYRDANPSVIRQRPRVAAWQHRSMQGIGHARLECPSNYYLYLWRFRGSHPSETGSRHP